MPAARRPAVLGVSAAVALTLAALFLLDLLIQQHLGHQLGTVGLATRAGPGVISLGELGMGAGAGEAVSLAHAQAEWAWRYGGALVVGLGTAGVLLNGVAAGAARRLEAWLPRVTPRASSRA
jgi:hypothetical protein